MSDFSKHTEGPWRVDEGLSSRKYWAISGDDWLRFAKVYRPDPTTEELETRTLTEWEAAARATAKLIAAAPDLLEACEVALTLWDSTSAALDPEDILPLLRAAIAQARGDRS